MSDTIQELVDLGKECFDNREYEKAEGYFKEALRANDRFADVHNLMGVINHLEGKFDDAIKYFKQALSINPKYTEALLNLAVLYNDLGKYDQAKKLYGNLKKAKGKKTTKKEIEPVLRGKLSNMHAAIGDIYRSTGIYDLAVGEYEKALDLNPNYLDIRTKLGVALREAGRNEESVKELKKVLKEKPKFFQTKVQLGVTYYSQSKLKEAKKEWEDVLKDDDKNESAKMYLRLSST